MATGHVSEQPLQQSKSLSQFPFPKPKQIFQPITMNQNSAMSQSEKQLLETDAKRGKRRAFVSLWFKTWREFCWPITE